MVCPLMTRSVHETTRSRRRSPIFLCYIFGAAYFLICIKMKSAIRSYNLKSLDSRRNTMGLILLLVVLVLLFGGGGFYLGPPFHYYGGGLGTILVIVII